MTGAMTAFGLAVGGVSVACYLLMTRAEKIHARRTSRDGSGPDGASYADRTVEALLAGSPAIIPRPTIPAIPSMAAAVTAEVGVMGAAAEMAVVEAIEGARLE